MSKITFQFNDGGRAEAGLKGQTGDCVCRATAIAARLPYRQVYDDLNRLAKTFNAKNLKSVRGKSSAREGVHKQVYHDYILSLGATWHSCMQIGTGCRTHLRPDELPKGRIIVRLSKHLAAVIDGVLMDTHDSSRDGTRCVYGFYKFDQARKR